MVKRLTDTDPVVDQALNDQQSTGLGRFPGGGHGNLLQYSCLENPMDRGAWQATAHSVAKSDNRSIQFDQQSSLPPLGQ